MMTLGDMEKGDYICVNRDQHISYECFETEELMRVHSEKCLKIPLSDGYNMLVLPDSTKEPARKVKLPSTVKGYTRGRGRGRAMMGPLIPMPAYTIGAEAS